ncbi:MAG: hypothetical protein DSZ08_00210 [Sulfurovum sp.]|nr:MAG: hypothetical protein DSZ08_00210 [Sulfurovum sp.]
MKEKIDLALVKIDQSPALEQEDKSAIMEKIEEWRDEDAAISELTLALEEWWLNVQPIFEEIGLV